MAMTSMDIPVELLEGAMRILGATTKRETVIRSLEEIVRRNQQDEAIELLGAAPWMADLLDPDLRAQARR